MEKDLKDELCDYILRDYSEFLEWFNENEDYFPELSNCKGVLQNNLYHKFDVFEHTMKTLENSPNNLLIRIVMLFHDIGKPSCKTTDDKKIDHFYKHAIYSSIIAKDILSRLNFEDEFLLEVITLIKYHDYVLKASRKCMRKLGTSPNSVKQAISKAFQKRRSAQINHSNQVVHIPKAKTSPYD